MLPGQVTASLISELSTRGKDGGSDMQAGDLPLGCLWLLTAEVRVLSLCVYLYFYSMSRDKGGMVVTFDSVRTVFLSASPWADPWFVSSLLPAFSSERQQTRVRAQCLALEKAPP